MEEQNNLTRDEARARASLVHEARYRVVLDLTEEGQTFGSDTTVWFRSEEGGSTFLDLIAESIESIELNGRALPVEVFDGTKEAPYDESDAPAPINAYGRTKWEGECFVQTLLERYYVVRASWLYGPGGPCFIVRAVPTL